MDTRVGLCVVAFWQLAERFPQLLLSRFLKSSAAAFLAVLLPGCTTMKLPPYPTQSATSYTQHKTADGVAIGIRPMIDKAECKQYFGTDLSKANILPVFVVIENTNSSSSFIFSRESTGLRTASDSKDTARRQNVGSGRTGEALGWASAGLIIASPAAAIPMLLAAGKAISNASIIKHNFEVNELRSTTLAPSGTARGFLYFPLPKGKDISDVGVLQIEAVETTSRQTNRFEFPLGSHNSERAEDENAS